MMQPLIVSEADNYTKELTQAVMKNHFHQLYFIKIKIIDICNLRCKKCRHWRPERAKSPDRKNALSTEELFKLADQAIELGVKKVRFSGGEPTLHPDIVALVSHFSKHKVKCAMTTNGTLLDTGIGRELIEAGLHRISLSIDGHTPELHDLNVGVPGAFERQALGIKSIRNAAAEFHTEVPITINTVVNQTNAEYLPRIVEVASAYGAQELVLIPIKEDYLPEKMGLIGDFLARFETEILPELLALEKMYQIHIVAMGYLRDESGYYRRVSSSFLNHAPCVCAWERLAVWPNGDVQICCETRNPKLRYGNTRDSSLAQMLTGPTANKILTLCQEPAKHVADCRRCSMDLDRRAMVARQYGFDPFL